MSSFLYFFPGNQVTKIENIPDECGLKETLAGASGDWAGTGSVSGQKGPAPNGDQFGTLLALHAKSPDGNHAPLGYFPERQTWLPVENVEGRITHYVGYDQKPRPFDLQRERELCSAGLGIVLEGQEWIVPVANMLYGWLPTRPQFKRGAIEESVIPKYLPLAEQADKIVKAITSDPPQSLSTLEHYNFAVDLLAVNYRIGKPELCLLNLLNSENVQNVVSIGIGLELHRRIIERKKEGASLPS